MGQIQLNKVSYSYETSVISCSVKTIIVYVCESSHLSSVYSKLASSVLLTSLNLILIPQLLHMVRIHIVAALPTDQPCSRLLALGLALFLHLGSHSFMTID
jgi:hypothetical protein